MPSACCWARRWGVALGVPYELGAPPGPDDLAELRGGGLIDGAALTHGDPLAGDSCVLWSEAIRVAVLEGRIDVEAGLDLLPGRRRDDWALLLRRPAPSPRDVPAQRVHRHRPAGSGRRHQLHAGARPPAGGARVPPLHLQHSLHAAIRIGDDTDTVAAIAGGLLGARWGASAVPWHWRRIVHGWPGLRSRDLQAFGTSVVTHARVEGWPDIRAMDYREPAGEGVVEHPYDSGVLLGSMRSLGHGTTAVVSLCRVGTDEPLFGGATPETVPLHCVAAQQRTPSVALAYAALLGHGTAEAATRIRQDLASTRGSGVVREAAKELGPR